MKLANGIVTFARNDTDGRMLNPSSLITHLRQIFPKLEIEEFSADTDWREAEHANELVQALVEIQNFVGGEVTSLKSKEKLESRHLDSYGPTKVGRVWINDRQHIEGVPETAWAFPIGGYLPAQRWLKDRIGRTLGYDEREEYCRIIWALMETKRLMSEIDTTIEVHGGWPLP